MNKKQLQTSIDNVENSLKISRDNLKNAQYHIEEGEIILTALKEKQKSL